MQSYDYIIVGSGIAGLYTALLAQHAGRVLLITKGSLEECNTLYAQGGIAAAIGPGDSPDLHRGDTEMAGAGLNDLLHTRTLAEDGPDRIADLIRFGVSFDTVDGRIALGHEGAHSVPRVLHAGGDATGKHIELALAAEIEKSNVSVWEHSLLAEIELFDGTVTATEIFDNNNGVIKRVPCRRLVLATGGAGQLFKLTTNSEVVTGDGVALAYRAGAEVMDMEFFQFHPTALRLRGAPAFLISEAVRGEGGVLVDGSGRRFMEDYAIERDLAARDVVARAIVSEMRNADTDHVYLDVRHLPASQVQTRFPQINQFCLGYGIDITQDLIPVAPAAHYMMGGVKVNGWGQTTVPGLLAVGETSCTGAHGANRLASNSLLETLVFSKRMVAQTLETAPPRDSEQASSRLEELRRVPKRDVKPPRHTRPTLAKLQRLMWDNVGIERTGPKLEEAVNTLAAWEQTLEAPSGRYAYDLRSALVTGRLMAEAALYRTESRGAHYRSDFPEPSNGWLKHVLLVR